MKFDKKYLIEHRDEIANSISCRCLKDSVFQDPTSLNITHCYKSIIYKFTRDKKLAYEVEVLDVDRKIIFEERYIQLTDEEFKNFKVIGNVFDLVKYFENGEWEADNEKYD